MTGGRHNRPALFLLGGLIVVLAAVVADELDGPRAGPTPAAERATAVHAAADALDRAADAMVSYGTRAVLTGTGSEIAFRVAENLRSCAAAQRRGMGAYCHITLDTAASIFVLHAVTIGRPRFPEREAITARYAIADARRAQEAAGFKYPYAPDLPPEYEPLRVWTGDYGTPDGDAKR